MYGVVPGVLRVLEEGVHGSGEPFTLTETAYVSEICNVPCAMQCRVRMNHEQCEFIPFFSLSLAAFRSAEADALTWHLSPHRSDFTFRTRVFLNFPSSIRLAEPVRAIVGEWYTVRCEISEESAVMFLDGVPYASCELSAADGVPSSGYFGFIQVRSSATMDIADIQICDTAATK
eukprot:TRINITY_DN1607_c0_g1_i1.p1 TRINITY_DN1607_c0_g1~~TRINITY_DN1607_c0_g1_i1.p1  ORF type:complete len:175 (+),score=33.49 TRINITY_DN1607_c0_g1_i1:227-751(+)